MIQFIYTLVYRTGDSLTWMQRAKQHCEVAIVADKYMVPDLVDQSAGMLVESLTYMYQNEERLLVMNRLLESITSRNSPMYEHLIPFWEKYKEQLTGGLGKKRIAEFLFNHPTFAAHVVAEQL
jgi:hypothetical protein